MCNFSPVAMIGTATFVVKSSRLEDELQIDVSMPVEYEESARNYPVVYLIDGHWFFPIVAQTMRVLEMAGEMRPVIVAGIGYRSKGLPARQEEECIKTLRLRDLTPTHDTTEWWREPGRGNPPPPNLETGGADRFVEVLEGDVKPLVARSFRTDSSDQTLAGFSLGGLFALYALLRHTALYQRYVAASPSLWWHNRSVMDFEAQYARHNADLARKVFISIGDREESGQNASSKMITNTKLLTERILARGYPSLEWHSLVLQNATHATAIAPALIAGLIAVYDDSTQVPADMSTVVA